MPTTECEAEERNQRALYLLQNEWGCGRIDVSELVRILRGETCAHATAAAWENITPAQIDTLRNNHHEIDRPNR